MLRVLVVGRIIYIKWMVRKAKGWGLVRSESPVESIGYGFSAPDAPDGNPLILKEKFKNGAPTSLLGYHTPQRQKARATDHTFGINARKSTTYTRRHDYPPTPCH